MIARGRVTHEDVFRALHEVATAAAGGMDPGQIAQLAATRCRTLLDADGTGVRWLDDPASELRLLAAAARQPTDHPSSMPLHGSLVGRAVLERRSITCDDYQAAAGALDWAKNTGIASIVVVPLLVGSRAVGAISVFSYTLRPFSEEERQLVELLAAAIGPALEAARLNSEIGRSASRLREAYEVMSCGVIQGRAGEPLELNRAAIEILGVEAARMLTGPDQARLTMWDETGSELGEPDLPFLRVLATRRALRGVTNRIQIGSGPAVWIHGDVVPIIDEAGLVTSVVASFVDVSAMKEAEDARRRSEALFKEAFENSALGMHITSVETGQIVQANRALHAILGYDSGELIGMPIGELSRLGKDEAETIERRRLLIEGHVKRLLHRRRLKTKDGRTVTVEVNVGLVRDPEGKALYTVAQIADVTKQVRVESVLRHEADRMVEIVKAQTEVYDNDLDVSSVMEMLAEKARILTGADGATITLLDGWIVHGRAFSGDRGGWPNSGDELAASFARHCASIGETIFTADATSDPRVDRELARANGTESIAASPLRHDGLTTGVIQVRSTHRAAFGEREAKTLELIAGLAAAAITRAEMITAIRQSEERLSALVASAPVVVSAIAPNGVITMAVGKGLADLGLDPADRVGKSIHLDGTGPDVIQAVGRALTGETCVTVGRNPNLERDFETHFSPIRDKTDTVTGVIAVAFDVTERLAAERELAESRARLSAVVANAPVITFAFNREGEVLLAEGAGLARLGMEPGVPVGMNVFEIFSGVAEALEHIHQGLAGESYECVVHIPAFDADFDVRYGPVVDADGRITGMSGLATDITDRVRVELAERENETKSRLMAMMNHEVRTPLNSVLGFAELLHSGLGGELNEKQTRYVSNIESAGRHLLSLVNDSLDLAKLDAEKMPLVMNDLELGPILDQAIGQVQPLAEARGVTLTAECVTGLYVSADRRRLLQVLWNLLSNAIKHSSSGMTILLHGRPVGGLVEIAVTDEGTGIPPDQLEKIFEEFHQVGASQIEGTGLGLAVCRRLVALMGGSIRVESELGSGTTFTVTLRPEARTGGPWGATTLATG